MDQIKRFVDCAVPVLTCNLRCPYCFITQERKFLSELPQFAYSPETIGRAFAPERWGGLLHINMGGSGETLLPSEMTPILYEVLKQGHYIAVVTNGTVTKRFQEICQFPEEFRKRLLFKISFHYLELARLKMLDRFFDNIQMLRDAGCSFSLELTPDDYYIPHIDDIQKICMERVGAPCHVTVARKETDPDLPILTDLSREDYLKTWGAFNSELFKFKMQTFNVKRKEFCYAGDWSTYLNLGTGILKQCYCGRAIQNIFDNPDEPIRWAAIGANCPEPHCYNAHAWMTLGTLPAVETPSYASMRDRVTVTGDHWLQPEMREFIGGQLKTLNPEYDEAQKKAVNRKEGLKIGLSYKIRKAAKKVFYCLPKDTRAKLFHHVWGKRSKLLQRLWYNK